MMLNKFKHSKSQQLLLFAILLVALRIFKFQDPKILYVIWNLYLAYLPLLILRQISIFKSNFWKAIILSLGILMLPNAIYIFVDIAHIQDANSVPLWYDSMIFFCFSALGMLYFTKSLFIIGNYLESRNWTLRFISYAQVGLIFVASFGVYIQHNLGLKSWNIISKPVITYHKLSTSLNFENLFDSVKITLIFSTFIYILYSFMQQKFSKE